MQQKLNVFNKIRNFAIFEAKRLLAAEKVLPDWEVRFSPKEISEKTGLAVSTIKRFINGALRPNNKSRTYGCLAAYGVAAFDTVYLQSQLWF